MITIEHVLPQNPLPDSQWCTWFTTAERAKWTHRLANLVLLNRNKNAEAARYEFDKKKEKYFTGKNGVVTFALTSQVIGKTEWTPEVLQTRQVDLMDRLIEGWQLDN